MVDNIKNAEKCIISKDEMYDEISICMNEIRELACEINKLFEFDDLNKANDINNKTIFNWNFKKEYHNGFIEYKRNLLSYTEQIKIEKLLRQIYWRIYEGIITDNINYCYYFIGLEDSGKPSYSSDEDLTISIDTIKKSIIDTELKILYKFFYNSEKNYSYIIAKIWLDKDNQNIEYFL